MILNKIFDLNTVQCCLITASVFMLSLHKKNLFSIRLITGIILGLLCAPLLSLYQHQTVGIPIAAHNLALSAIGTVSNLLIYVFLISILFYYCCQVSLLNALYYATCAYLTQDLAYTIFVFLLPGAAHRAAQTLKPNTLWLEILLIIGCNFIFYHIFAKRLFIQINQKADCLRALIYMLFVLCIGRILGTYSKMNLNSDTQYLFRFMLLYDVLLTLNLLIAQILLFNESRYHRELVLESQLRHQQYQQFKDFQETTENIRHKCHDLKHIISALTLENNTSEWTNLLQELESSIYNYDSTMHTGNSTLDAILEQTWRTCDRKQIQWTCLADGKPLNFINAFDLYVLFGNALDNAVEHLSDLDDPQKKVLAITIRPVHQLVFITIKNYCDHAPVLKDNLPVTTKNNKAEHGYGMKSIQSIVNKYNGELSIKFDDSIFILDIMFPISP